MGGQNCHAEITFEDGIKWLARFRLASASSPPQDIRDWILRSEAATMTFLQQHTSIPTPKILDWACESEPQNMLGVDYILMEKLNGRVLDWKTATNQQKEKVMQQLVDIYLEIERYTFDKIGSLAFSTDGTIGVQALALPSTYKLDSGPLGPFTSCREGAQALLGCFLAMIASGEIDSYSPADSYLVHKHLQELSSSIFPDNAEENKFYLKHPDDKGDHILVNDDFDIMGIIDWEWTHTVSKAEAFSSPCMMWPLVEFYDGSNELSTEELRLADIYQERGREDLAACVLNGRKAQRLLFASGVESSFLDRQTFLPLFAGLQKAFDLGKGHWETWKVKALAKWKSDTLLQSLLGQGLDGR
ncbi:hypothetical protein BDW69DRAFT_179839 [Aspergillus filifer]